MKTSTVIVGLSCLALATAAATPRPVDNKVQTFELDASDFDLYASEADPNTLESRDADSSTLESRDSHRNALEPRSLLSLNRAGRRNVSISLWCEDGQLDPAHNPAELPITYADSQNALANLFHWCGAGNQVQPRSRLQVVTEGTAAAFVCTYGGRQPCSRQEFRWLEAKVGNYTRACINSGHGWLVRINAWKKGLGVLQYLGDPLEHSACREPQPDEGEFQIEYHEATM